MRYADLPFFVPWPGEPSVPKNVLGWNDDRHRQAFDEIIPQTALTILEVGTWFGQGALTFAQLRPKANILCIDPFLIEPGLFDNGKNPHMKPFAAEAKQYFQANLFPYRDRVFLYKTTSALFFSCVRGSMLRPDAIYIDGDHSYFGALFDILWCLREYPDAVIFGDDFPLQSVKEALADACFIRNRQCEVVNGGRTWKII